MIAHVAAADEKRGRVVLRLTSANPSRLVIEAALRIARAFESEMESLFVEDTRLFDLTRYAFAREISVSGRRQRRLDDDTLSREMLSLAIAVRRRLDAIAVAFEVPMRHRVVRDEPVHALARACAESGPWNVVAIAEPFGIASGPLLARLVEEVRDATGILLVGPRSVSREGPLLAVVESEAQLGPMLQSAERLRGDQNVRIVLLLATDDVEELGWVESQARLIVADRHDVSIASIGSPLANAEVIAETMRRLRPGFVIAHFGGILVPREGHLGPLSSALEAPLLLLL